MISILGLLFASLFAIFLARRVLRAMIGGRATRTVDRGRTCRCGYDLSRLELPRCPECGLVAHFDATADQMGLTDDELARIGEAQRRRRAAEAGLTPPPDDKRR